MRWAAIVVAVSSACTTEPTFTLEVVSDSPLAMGASTQVYAFRSLCDSSGHCDYSMLSIESIEFDPPGLLEITDPGPTVARVRAVGEGTSTLTVVASDGERHTFTRGLETLNADRAVVTPSLHGLPCPAPARFALGVTALLPFELRHGDVAVHGESYVPFTVTMPSDASISSERSTDGTLAVRLPSVPGTVSLASSIDPGFSLAIEAFAPQLVEAVTLGEPVGRLVPLGSVEVPIDLVVGGQPICGDALSRTLTVLTPQQCELDGGLLGLTSAGDSEAGVRGLRPGPCTLRVTLDGTSLSATKTLTVSM